MGGSGHNSKMNARIIYVPVATNRPLDNPLNLAAFEDFQSYFIDHIQNRILRNQPVSTTAMWCDSCVTIEGRPVFVHEAKSESIEYEEKKVIFHKARCLPYVKKPFSMITDGRFCYLGSLTVNEQRKELEYAKMRFEYCPPEQKAEKAEAVSGIIRFVQIIARVLKSFTTCSESIVTAMANTKIDDPQLRSPEFMQHVLGRYEGFFCMDRALGTVLPPEYLEEVFECMRQDMENGVVLKIIGKDPVAHTDKLVWTFTL